MISNPIQFKSGGETASIFAYGTGMTSGLTCTATKGSKVKTGVWSSRSRLPEGYTEVDSIYTTSNGPYFRFSNIHPTNHYLKIRFKKTSSTSASANVFNTYGSAASGLYFGMTVYNNSFYWGRNGSESSYGTVGTTEHTFEYNKGDAHQVIIDGTVVSSGTEITTSSSDSELTLFRKDTTDFIGYLYEIYVFDKTNNVDVFNGVPCINPNNVVGLYDLVSKQFYGNSGSGTLYAGSSVTTTGYQISGIDEFGTWNVACTGFTSVDVNVDAVDTFSVQMQASGRLPSGYTEVEYIEGTGTQWINTGFINSSSAYSRVVIEASPTELSTSYMICGGYTYDGNYKRNIMCAFTNLNGIYRPSVGVAQYAEGGFYSSSVSCSVGTKYTFDIVASNGSLSGTINGYSVSGTYTAAYLDVWQPSYLFAYNYIGRSAAMISPFRMYSCKMYDTSSTDLVRDFVPCINPSNVVGMYDLVTSTFYGNSGSGVFIAGNPV